MEKPKMTSDTILSAKNLTFDAPEKNLSEKHPVGELYTMKLMKNMRLR